MTYKKLCILTDNAADRSTITVGNTAEGSGASNLKTDIKGQVCRVLSGTADIVLTWPEATSVGAIVLPVTSLGPSSTVQVKAYGDEAGTVLLQDTGAKWAAPGAILANWGFTQPLNVNQFAFSLPPTTAVYLAQHESVRRLEVKLVDPSAEFIDIARLVVGPYYTPNTNPAYDQADSILDMSKNTRTASGDLKTDRGPKVKTMTFSLENIDDAHRAEVRQILEMGIGRFIFVSLTPGSYDPVRERDKSIYGKVSQPITMRWGSYSQHLADFNIEGF
jgi:hypothetical protein